MRTLSPPAASSSRSASRSVSRPIFVEISAAAEIKGAIDSLVLQHAQALVMPNNSIVDDHRAEIVDAAMKHSLPTMAENVDIVRLTGALAAYGVTLAERDRLRAEYIDRILRGAKPADLPVQQPTKFELAINLKTAKALGITVPQALLLRTDALIQ